MTTQKCLVIDMTCCKNDDTDATMSDCYAINDAIIDAMTKIGMSCCGTVKIVSLDENGDKVEHRNNE